MLHFRIVGQPSGRSSTAWNIRASPKFAYPTMNIRHPFSTCFRASEHDVSSESSRFYFLLRLLYRVFFIAPFIRRYAMEDIWKILLFSELHFFHIIFNAFSLPFLCYISCRLGIPFYCFIFWHSFQSICDTQIFHDVPPSFFLTFMNFPPLVKDIPRSFLINCIFS